MLKAATPTLNPNTLPTVGMAAKLAPRPSHSLVVPKERTGLFRLRIQQQVGRASESVTGTTRLHGRGLLVPVESHSEASDLAIIAAMRASLAAYSTLRK